MEGVMVRQRAYGIISSDTLLYRDCILHDLLRAQISQRKSDNIFTQCASFPFLLFHYPTAELGSISIWRDGCSLNILLVKGLIYLLDFISSALC